jgi:hypothetical protein
MKYANDDDLGYDPDAIEEEIRARGNVLHLILSALDDAADFRRLPSDWCDDCGKQPEGQECAEHDSDGAIARDYDELAERLRARERERSVCALAGREVPETARQAAP